MSVPTKEEIAEVVRVWKSSAYKTSTGDVMSFLSDENDRLRAERDECVALFESYGNDMHWTAKMDALLAKLRTP